jgi:hypothetical protein
MKSEQSAQDAETQRKVQERKIQAQLDEALADSFPASDPVSIVTSQNEEDWTPEAPAAANQPVKP